MPSSQRLIEEEPARASDNTSELAGSASLVGATAYKARRLKITDVAAEEDEDIELYKLMQVPIDGVNACGLLRPGAIFTGKQVLEKHIYKVEVSIMAVSVPEPFMSGCLQVSGLTAEQGILTTYFEAEIVGPKFSFSSNKKWGATEEIDLLQWQKLLALRNREGSHRSRKIEDPEVFRRKRWWEERFIYMRWKEFHLNDYPTIKSIQGASFDGFYYISLDQQSARIMGLYCYWKLMT
jgi:glucose-induced degradation protein 4